MVGKMYKSYEREQAAKKQDKSAGKNCALRWGRLKIVWKFFIIQHEEDVSIRKQLTLRW